MAAPTVVVDAENVRRSTWPNVGRAELVELCRSWASARGVRAVVVFDGPAPGLGPGKHVLDEHCTVVGTSGETADEWILRATRGAGHHWLVTSDRALRELAGDGAERTIGGGAFLKELQSSR
jgi:predicted RNA-binding protein with PIN domain